MKKITAFLLCLLVLATCLFFFACKKEDEEAPPSDEPQGDPICTHMYGDWSEETAATCGAEGREVRTCTICNGQESRSIPATEEHSFDANYRCGVCGLTVVETEGLLFEAVEGEDAYIVIGVEEGAELENIVVPCFYEEKPVVAVADGAFKNAAVKSITLPASIRSLGVNSFEGCASLIRVTVAAQSELKVIGEGCFKNCANLKGFDLTQTKALETIEKAAFLGCAKLEKITLPETLVSIGESAFEGCSSLLSFKIPSSVAILGVGVLKDCSNLAELSVSYIGSAAVQAEYTHLGYLFGTKDYRENNQYVPASLKTLHVREGVSIADRSAFGCSGLKKVILPDTLQSIGAEAFVGTALSAIDIPASVKNIDNKAFFQLSALEKVTFAEGSELKTIGESAFADCQALPELAIPVGVASIGENVLQGCKKLKTLSIPFVGSAATNAVYTHLGYLFGAKTYLYNNEFIPASLETVNLTAGEYIADKSFFGCVGLKKVTLPVGLIGIGESAFAACTSLAEMHIPASVKSIGGYAFSSCEGLTKIGFAQGSSLTMLGAKAFYDCNKITSLTLSASLLSIGAYALSDCDALGTITYLGTIEQWQEIAKEIGWNFATNRLTIVCNNGSVAADGTVTR